MHLHKLIGLLSPWRKTLPGQRLALIFLCKVYRTVNTEALSILVGVPSIDLEVQRRATMYYVTREYMAACFLVACDRNNIFRLFNQQADVYDELVDEWQHRWQTFTKGLTFTISFLVFVKEWRGPG